MSESLSPERLAEIRAVAAHVHEYGGSDRDLDDLIGTDVPALLGEVERMRSRIAELEARPATVTWDGAASRDDADGEVLVCCRTGDGRPVALLLDAEHAEALGLLLVDPEGDAEPEDEPDVEDDSGDGERDGDFFAPGHLYTEDAPFRAPEDRPNFRCVAVAVHPTTGGRRALGFEQPGAGRPWRSVSLRDEEWLYGWVDITGGGDGRG
jgi:hypothetical protein